MLLCIHIGSMEIPVLHELLLYDFEDPFLQHMSFHIGSKEILVLHE